MLLWVSCNCLFVQQNPRNAKRHSLLLQQRCWLLFSLLLVLPFPMAAKTNRKWHEKAAYRLWYVPEARIALATN